MASKATQDEMESPAKQWQVAAVDDKVTALTTLVQTMAAKQESTISVKMFEDRVNSIVTSIIEKMNNELGKRDSKIEDLEKALKQNNSRVNKFTAAIISASVFIVGAAIVILLFGRA